MLKYYTITVELHIEADSKEDAFDMIENHIDSLVQNNSEMQDYYIQKDIVEEIVE